MKNKFGLLLMCIGLFTILLPSYKQYILDKEADSLQALYEKSMQNIAVLNENDPFSSEVVDIGYMNTEIATTNEIISHSDSPLEATKITNKTTDNLPIEGMLNIPDINFNMVVIEDATVDHLNVSVSSIHSTGKPWTEGNYVIAGHRSRTYGRHFNRLNEIEIGDSILFTNSEHGRYTYKVTETMIVDQYATWVMDNESYRQITLITCDPIHVKNPPTRLIIKGQLIEHID